MGNYTYIVYPWKDNTCWMWWWEFFFSNKQISQLIYNHLRLFILCVSTIQSKWKEKNGRWSLININDDDDYLWLIDWFHRNICRIFYSLMVAVIYWKWNVFYLKFNLKYLTQFKTFVQNKKILNSVIISPSIDDCLIELNDRCLSHIFFLTITAVNDWKWKMLTVFGSFF